MNKPAYLSVQTHTRAKSHVHAHHCAPLLLLLLLLLNGVGCKGKNKREILRLSQHPCSPFSLPLRLQRMCACLFGSACACVCVCKCGCSSCTLYDNKLSIHPLNVYRIAKSHTHTHAHLERSTETRRKKNTIKTTTRVKIGFRKTDTFTPNGTKKCCDMLHLIRVFFTFLSVSGSATAAAAIFLRCCSTAIPFITELKVVSC